MLVDLKLINQASSFDLNKSRRLNPSTYKMLVWESQPRHECRWTNSSLWTISATCSTSAPARHASGSLLLSCTRTRTWPSASRWTNCSPWTINATCSTSAQQLDTPVDRRYWAVLELELGRRQVHLSYRLTWFTLPSSRREPQLCTVDLPHKCRVCFTWIFVLLFILVVIIVLCELLCNLTLVEYFSQCIRSIWISYVAKTLCIWMLCLKTKISHKYVLLFPIYFILFYAGVLYVFKSYFII